jgi:hypothetical protein
MNIENIKNIDKPPGESYIEFRARREAPENALAEGQGEAGKT